MNSHPDREEAASTVLIASLPFLKSDESERVKGQLSYIVRDMKEECQQSLSIGGSNGCANELTNWDVTKKRRLGM